jgi:hypothetical protein
MQAAFHHARNGSRLNDLPLRLAQYKARPVADPGETPRPGGLLADDPIH